MAPPTVAARAPLSARPALAPRRAVVARGSAVSQADMVPDMKKRWIMNGLLVGAGALPTAGLAFGFIDFFVPPRRASCPSLARPGVLSVAARRVCAARPTGTCLAPLHGGRTPRAP